mmetsp:Transcript_29201/g.53852  ORF Transcript_29201/g.53852 Transcript_29201/m.53852 type:complete len:492 (-) Transcript_29201:76-1551(-)
MAISIYRSAITAALTLLIAEGAVRTLVEQQDAGECAKNAQTGDQYFPADYLATYRKLGAVGNLDAPISSAELIQIDYGSNFKVLTEKFAKEQYVLTQCGTLAPTDAEINLVKTLPSGYTRKHFSIPLQEVRAESTVQLSFLDVLGLHDRVSYISKYAVGSCWQKSISCGGVAADSYGNQTLQSEQRTAVDAFFADCPWDYTTNAPNCKALNSMAKAVHFSASQDPAPLHSAEHVKFMAAFFNKEEEAEQFFQSKVSAMQALKQESSASDSDKPLVAWIEKSWDGKVKLSTADYQKLLVEYAGGEMVDAAAVKSALGDKMDASHQTEDVSAFFDALKDVDAVIDLTYSSDVATYDFEAFLKGYGLDSSSDLPFIKNEKVFRVDMHVSGKSNLDWFESRLAQPDMAVEGLQRVLKPDSSKPKKYFRNIATGEAVEVVKKDACTAKLMTCNPSDYPAELPMIDKLGQVSSAVGQLSMSAVLTVASAVATAATLV